MSLFLTLKFQDTLAGTATGFVVQRQNQAYLITNFHVLSGRDSVSHKSRHPQGLWPDSVEILHTNGAGGWVTKTEALYGKIGALWLEHPTYGSRVDVVALPLTDTTGVRVHSYDPWAALRVSLGVSNPLNIVGFPFGELYSGGLAVWIRGFIASEPEVDYQDLPLFLIDSRTRKGQSGSPVIFYSADGSYLGMDGTTHVATGEIQEFVGVYSGRINEDSDLGFVWKRSALCQILDSGIPSTVDTPL